MLLAHLELKSQSVLLLTQLEAEEDSSLIQELKDLIHADGTLSKWQASHRRPLLLQTIQNSQGIGFSEPGTAVLCKRFGK